jgi:hypothetical protein
LWGDGWLFFYLVDFLIIFFKTKNQLEPTPSDTDQDNSAQILVKLSSNLAGPT